MNKHTNTQEKDTVRIWIISEGQLSDIDLSRLCEEPVSGPVTEYEISALGQYLINPNSLSLEEKVIGCKIHYHKPRTGKFGNAVRRIFTNSNPGDNANSLVEEVVSASKIGATEFKDERLNQHFMKIREQLKPYDAVHKRLTSLDRDKIENITAICEDIGKVNHQLNLQGSINEKINFIMNSLLKKVKVAFNRSYLLRGLFEMRGFPFTSYNPDKIYRLIKFTQENQAKYCVLSKDYKLIYWIDDNTLINYLQLFEQSVRIDPQLRDAINLCIQGKAQPLKLFFSKQREKSYSENHLPRLYRDMLSKKDMDQNKIKTITNILNNFQSIVSFNYVPFSGAGKSKLYTNISVMHDIKALEPIKATMPEVYSRIDQKACISDAGKLYLLDSMRGYQNV